MPVRIGAQPNDRDTGVCGISTIVSQDKQAGTK
jgi:hypothetical protein